MYLQGFFCCYFFFFLKIICYREWGLCSRIHGYTQLSFMQDKCRKHIFLYGIDHENIKCHHPKCRPHTRMLSNPSCVGDMISLTAACKCSSRQADTVWYHCVRLSRTVTPPEDFTEEPEKAKTAVRTTFRIVARMNLSGQLLTARD